MKKNKKPNKPVKNGVAKVPVVIQMEALECGAASLTMILAYYGKWIPLEKVRRDCGVSRDGSNALNIILAARNYGLKAKGYSLDVDDICKEIEFPCIIHWNFNHFVVLKGVKKNKFYLNDPAKGSYAVPLETFKKSFTGITLAFSPSESFVPEGKEKSVIPFAFKKIKGSWIAFFFILLTTIISSVMGLIGPVFSNFYIDRLLTYKNPEWFLPFIYLLSGLTLVEIIVQIINANLSRKIDGKIAVTSNARYMWHVFNLPLEFFEQRTTGDIISRKNQNASIAKTLINLLVPLLIETCLMFFYLFIVIKYSYILTLIGIASLLINGFVSNYTAKKRINLDRVNFRDASKLNSYTYSGINMIDSIKSSGAESGFLSKWLGYSALVNNNEVKISKLGLKFEIFSSIISLILTNFITMAGLYLCMKGEWTVGMVSAFSGFLSSFLSPARQLISAHQSLQEMRSQMERIEDVFNYPSDDYLKKSELDEGKTYDKLSGDIEVKNLTFGYSPLGEPVIKNISFNVKSGETIALVGASGSGKSTISKVLLGLYRPRSGEIKFDGVDLVDIDKNVLKASIGCVNQDIVIFPDTVANNIKMWDNSIEDYEMILAAKDAKIHDTIMTKEGGYNYMLSDGAKEFSGGEKQRLEIARVLASDPSIIILDEATSALDAKTEKEVVSAIKKRGITTIVIAHRLSTIREADKIYVLEKGEIKESGNHDELIAKNGLYSELVTSE